MKRKLYPTEKSILRGSRAARSCAGGAKACIRKTRRFGRRAAVFVTAAAACFAAAFCCRTAAADITLAVIAPKAGEYAQSGKELFDGARLAVREINDNGGLNGEKLDMLTIDDRCDDRLAISTAEMLTLLKSKKVGLVVGPYCSNRFDEIAGIYERAKIFQIVPTTVAYNAGSAGKKGQILLLGTKAQMSGDFFQFYNRNFAGLKVGFVYNDKPEDGYSEVAKALYDEFRRFGKGELLKFYALNREQGGMYDLARMMEKDGINVAFVLGENDETVNFIRAAKDVQRSIILFTSKNMVSPDSLKRLGKDAEGLYVMTLPGLKDSLMFTENLVNLRLLGIEPEGLEVYSYVAVKLWGDLVRQVNGFAYEKLAKAANSAALREKWSEFLMHSGSIESSKYIIEMYQNGEFRQVY